MDKIIKSKNCTQCSESFDITQDDRDFYEKISPVFGGKKFQIPDPTLCSACRQQRRFVWRNERNLYKRKCDATGKDIISMYSPVKSIKVYGESFWWSDKWDGMEYGKVFDKDESFFLNSSLYFKLSLSQLG